MLGQMHSGQLYHNFLSMEYSYFKTIQDPQDPTKVVQEKLTLVVETRVASFSEDAEVNNPTGDENAFFYWISIDGWREQVATFQPGEEGYQPMDKAEAEKFLEDDVAQTLLNYWIQ